MKKILTACMLCIYIQVYSQNTIQLLDQETDHPIAFAHFLYQNQKGNTNANGEFTIKHIEGEKAIPIACKLWKSFTYR